MRFLTSNIFLPAVLVGTAIVQSLGTGSGIDAVRPSFVHIADSMSKTEADSLKAADTVKFKLSDSLEATDSLVEEEVTLESPDTDTVKVIPVLDTLRIPDSLEFKDPFKFKYFKAIKDSATRAAARDSLLARNDTLELARLDSLYLEDSTEVARWKQAVWFNGLSKQEKKEYLFNRKMQVKMARTDSILKVKDSLRLRKDSIIKDTPRILETYVLPDSMKYKRILMWKHDRNFNDIHLEEMDTTFNYHFNDYPFLKNDVGATYLGVIGSAVQTYNWFKRDEEENAVFYSPYGIYSYTPSSLPMYNTKTPYTELAYWGTLFAPASKEESEIKILTTQNILPSLNVTLEYHRYGGNGMLSEETTDNRTCVIAGNYMGKRYLAHAGYIYHKIGRSENGGAIDEDENGFNWIRDTLVDARELPVRLADADNLIKKNTVFLDQSYRIPMSFINKLKGLKADKLAKAREDSAKARADTLLARGDSIGYEQYIEKLQFEADSLLALEDSLSRIADSLENAGEITSAFIGHSSEYSVYKKLYTDKISSGDRNAKAFYKDRFYINPASSFDSLRVMKFENKLYLRLQPWKSDAIVSKLDVGLGNKTVNYFNFNEDSYLGGSSNTVWNSTYMYAGSRGQLKKYFTWDATGKFTLLGYESGDLDITGHANVNLYPFRKHKNSPLSFNATFQSSLKEPDFYQQHLYTNHLRWNNDFNKISTTRIQASAEVPHWKARAEFGYALLDNNIYYDTLGIVRQNVKPMSVLSASLEKNFAIGGLHFDNRILAQFSSDTQVLPLPKLAVNLRYYYQFVVQRDETKTNNVMVMQIGANALWNTRWYSPSYNPVLGVFHNQNEVQYGNSPYIDAFVNVQWKRACIFIKAVNANMGWPAKKSDYFSAHHYIRSQRAIKFGVFWPFYVQSSGTAEEEEE